MEQPYLSVVIPAYNEERRIGTTLKKIKEYIDTLPHTVEVIVVINNTKDKTKDVVEGYIASMPYLKIMDVGHVKSQSGTKGYAVRKGILEAKGKYVVFMDADNATDLKEFDKLKPYLEEGYDVVFGSRFIRGAQTNRVWYRDLMGRIANILVRTLLLPKIYDTQCGFKAFSQTAAKEIFSRAVLKGWGFDLEVLAIARKLGYKLKEVPIVWNEIGESSLKAKAFATSFKELLEVKLNLKEGKYN